MQLINRLSPDNFLDHSVHGEAAVLRIRKSSDPKSAQPYSAKPEVLYWDDGSLITVLTGAAVDPARKKMIAGGVVAPHFVVCDLAGVNF